MEEKNKDRIINKAFCLGKEYESRYRSCAQCTVGALEDAFNLKSGELFKASTALAGGGGLTIVSGCGGFAGGSLFIGKILGRNKKDFNTSSSKSGVYGVVKNLYDRFIKTYGTVICKDIQKNIFGKSFNLLDYKEKEEFHKVCGSKDKCPLVVGRASRWTAELILKEHSQLFKYFIDSLDI